MKDYRRTEARQRLADALSGDLDAAVRAERIERYAGLLRVERGSAAYRISFPHFKERYADCRPMLAAVKAIPGRRFDSLSATWSIPSDQREAVELLADEYGATIEDADSTDDRIAELQHKLAVAIAERDAAVALADEYAAQLESVAA
jgi:hypothetical protein